VKRNKVAKQSKPGREKVDWKKPEVVHPDAAGMDVGSMASLRQPLRNWPVRVLTSLLNFGAIYCAPTDRF